MGGGEGVVGANNQNGCANHFLPKNAWKLKNFDPQGGVRPGAFLGFTNGFRINKLNNKLPVLTFCLKTTRFWGRDPGFLRNMT